MTARKSVVALAFELMAKDERRMKRIKKVYATALVETKSKPKKKARKG